MKNILTLLFTLISFVTLSQNYPVQTKLKGDSVVILTTEQYRDIELLLSNQRDRVNGYKNDQEISDYWISIQEKEIDSLKELLSRKKNIVDSLDLLVKTKLSNYDSLELKIKTIEDWLYNSAVDNAYLYYSHRDTTIMSIDLSGYALYGSKFSGSLTVVRRGFASEDEEWKKCNRLYPQEPDLNWQLKYREKWRPVVVEFPYKIKKQL
jgi:hypothetical protein